jgi:capsule polysaccharide modification protein KpsS
VLHQKIAYLEDYSYFDAGGFGPFSARTKASKTIKQIEKIDINLSELFFKDLWGKYVSKRKSKFIQKTSKFSVERHFNYYFFAMQTTNDTVLQSTYIPQYEAIEFILSEFEGSNRILVIKPHPMDQTVDTKNFLGKVNIHSNSVITEANIHDIIDSCTVTICINSGVGIETLLHLKPVITIGDSDYALATKPARNKIELANQLNSDLSNIDLNFIKKFLYYFFKNHVCHVDDKYTIKKRLSKIIDI